MPSECSDDLIVNVAEASTLVTRTLSGSSDSIVILSVSPNVGFDSTSFNAVWVWYLISLISCCLSLITVLVCVLTVSNILFKSLIVESVVSNPDIEILDNSVLYWVNSATLALAAVLCRIVCLSALIVISLLYWFNLLI